MREIAFRLAVACGVCGGVFLCCPFSRRMSWMRSGTHLSQFLRVFLPTLDEESYVYVSRISNAGILTCASKKLPSCSSISTKHTVSLNIRRHPNISILYICICTMAQMAHFSFPYYVTIPNSEFRIPNSEFRFPKFALRISEFGIVKINLNELKQILKSSFKSRNYIKN